MALTDSELLALVEKAQEARKGDKGEQGIGIKTVNSPEPGKLVIVLTDGTVNNFSFPSLKGDTGERGAKGEAGSSGAPGPMGPKGNPGVDGAPGVSVDSALVSGGNLLVGLSDGRAIDAGRVVGPAGPAGAPGADGVGRPGVDGRDGRDGSTILTGAGKPDLAIGKDGDLYLDVVSENLTLYKRTESSWLLLAELRPSVEVNRQKRAISGGVSGGGSAAGGGGSIIIQPGGPGPTPPTVDNDGVPVDNGDMWYDPDSGFIYIRHNNQWVLVAGHGPAFISPNPPSKDLGEHPIVEGDLWFDSDQAALYVAAKNTDGDIVWVITTPADRSVLDAVITTFRFPGSISNRAPVNGETVYNPVTELWYAYNAPKKQWIDLPPDSERILHTKLYLDAALDDTSTTAPYEAFVNTSDDETTTRLTVNRIDINDTDWSVIFKELRVGAELSLMQNYKEYDPVDPDLIVSEQLHISRYEVTKINLLPDGDTADTINMEVSYLDQDADLPHQFDDDVWFIINVSLNKFVKKTGDTMTGTLEIANEGDATNLDFDPDKANLTFTTTKTDGSASESVSIHQNGFNASLSITGGLVADGNYFTESGRYYGSDPNGPYFAARPPFLQLEQTEGTLQWNSNARVKWDALGGSLRWGDDARLEWNASNVEIPKPSEDDVNRDGFIIRGTTAAGYETEDPLHENGKLLSAYHNADKADAVNYAGKINAPSNLVNKQYVDDKDDLLRQDIIELEEEIDAIAPSVEYGTWKYEEPNNGEAIRSPQPGTFFLINGSVITDKYKETTAIKIHNDEFVAPDDQDPVDNHTWDNANVGELIQLFDAADPDFFLGRITAKSVDEIGEFVTLTVDRIQSSGAPNNKPDPLTNEFLTRINVFKEPTGGDASEFVKKIGDTMTGDLAIHKGDATSDVEARLTIQGSRPSNTNAAATIKFLNKQSPTDGGFLSYRSYFNGHYFSFSKDVEFSNSDLRKVQNIEMNSDGHIRYNSNDRVRVNSNGGSLRWSTFGKLFWGSTGVSIEKGREDNANGVGFTIKGKLHNTDYTSESYTHENGNLLYVYHNSGKTDEVKYFGQITDPKNLATKEYVDSKAGGGVKITCTAQSTVGAMWYCTNDQALYIKVS